VERLSLGSGVGGVLGSGSLFVDGCGFRGAVAIADSLAMEGFGIGVDGFAGGVSPSVVRAVGEVAVAFVDQHEMAIEAILSRFLYAFRSSAADFNSVSGSHVRSEAG
jgi:hypothetical protein